MILKVARYLSKFPRIKRAVKYFYQIIIYPFYRTENKSICKFKIKRISDENGGFFGYYDKSPESPDGKYVIFHALKQESDKVGITLYNKFLKNYREVDLTKAFNLQAASRLQWLGTDKFIFNSFNIETGNYFATIANVYNNEKTILEVPIYDVNGNLFLGIDYKNLASVGSEYGYDTHFDRDHYYEPVIYLGSISSATSKIIVDVKKMQTLLPEAFIKSSKHHFNHVSFAPDANSFIFIFRWLGPDGKSDALLHFDLKSEKIIILNKEMTSHCCWMNNETVIAYLRHDGINSYFKINTRNITFTNLFPGLTLSDGHPTWLKDQLLTDTYPNKERMQQIKIFSSGKILDLGKFYSPVFYNEKLRCDLHPRFNYEGTVVYFDSMHEGSRHLYMLTLTTNE